MNANRIGRTAVTVTELGFGGGPIGNMHRPIEDGVAEGCVQAAWQAGIRYFDTAPHYGLGLSERRLGSALRSFPRESYAVSTKIGRLLVPNPNPIGSDLTAGGFAVDDALTRRWDFSRAGVRRSIAESLTRLGLDRVDIAYVHDPDDHLDEAVATAIPALAELRDEGVVGAIGAGMNRAAPLRRLVAESDLDVVLLAGRWTLLDRTGQELLDACAARGLSVVAAAPFNSGVLATSRPDNDAYFDYHPARPDLLARAAAMAGICATAGVELPHAALRFPLQHPAVACVLAGMDSVEQVRADVGWIAADLPADIWRALG